MKITKFFCNKCKKEITQGDYGDCIKCRDFPTGRADLCKECFKELTKSLGITPISEQEAEK